MHPGKSLAVALAESNVRGITATGELVIGELVKAKRKRRKRPVPPSKSQHYRWTFPAMSMDKEYITEFRKVVTP